jgi:predicted phosphodiesterase
MRRLLQKWFQKPIIRLAEKYSARPDAKRVHSCLTSLYNSLITQPGKRGVVIPFNATQDKFIILSDQHKGSRNYADDFALSEKSYLAALQYYHQHQYHYVNLGDSEELWKNSVGQVIQHNKATFDLEKQFLQNQAFIKIYGNHDLYWDNSPLAGLVLQQLYGVSLKVYEGVVLQTHVNNKPLSIYLTHGHQGDLQSDGNWLSKWFVANIWGRLQDYLAINPNTPATNDSLKTKHNQIMYEWSSRQSNLLLITGHTHQPVFKSLTHLEHLYIELEKAQAAGNTEAIESLQAEVAKHVLKGEAKFSFPGYRPSYFNTGCCCYSDGDITGIEITEGCMRLVKWKYNLAGAPERTVLDEAKLDEIATGLVEIPQ